MRRETESKVDRPKEPELLPLDYRALFEALPGLFMVMLPDAPAFTIVAASDAYLVALHKSRVGIVGRSLIDVFPGGPTAAQATTQANVIASIQRVMDTGQPDST